MVQNRNEQGLLKEASGLKELSDLTERVEEGAE
jgi:hypothetical protein